MRVAPAAVLAVRRRPTEIPSHLPLEQEGEPGVRGAAVLRAPEAAQRAHGERGGVDGVSEAVRPGDNGAVGAGHRREVVGPEAGGADHGLIVAVEQRVNRQRRQRVPLFEDAVSLRPPGAVGRLAVKEPAGR